MILTVVISVVITLLAMLAFLLYDRCQIKDSEISYLRHANEGLTKELSENNWFDHEYREHIAYTIGCRSDENKTVDLEGAE
jgi:hypothetical protein